MTTPKNWPAWLEVTPRDWVEDAADEDNGCYGHQCRECKEQFTGHKRRPNICKVCANTPEPLEFTD